MPFADTVRICTVTGAELLRLLQANACRADRPAEAHTERGFLHFSSAVRYRIRLGGSRAEAAALDVAVCGHLLVEQRERTFTVACTSFVHMLCATWERQVAAQQRLALLDAHQLPREDTRLFLRNELIAYIRAHGGVTPESGARRDGRLIIENEEES
jgi:hypothetical protein